MKLTEKINFRQPKYMIPLVIYIPLLFCGYFVIELFNTEKADVDNSKLETTEYYNDKLPEAHIKGDGIGDKYSNMLNDFGKIKDKSAVENIDRVNDDTKESYESQYSDAELAAMDQSSSEAQASLERLRQIQQQIKDQQEKDNPLGNDRSQGNTEEEEQTLENLRKALAEARQEGLRQANGAMNDFEDASANAGTKARQSIEANIKDEEIEANVTTNENAVTEIAEEAKAEEVVKKQKETSEYFNTITTNEPEHKLIKAIIDEDIKAVDGSRVRLRLLDDIDIGERTIQAGSYLYCTMSGFSQQRVKGTVKSILYNDELIKVNLSLYDTDGLEGLYVPRSSFRETSQDIASGAMSQSMNLNDGSSSGSSFGRWGMQAIQNAYQKTTNAISKSIRKNKVKVKYGTQVYLINSKEKNRNNR